MKLKLRLLLCALLCLLPLTALAADWPVITGELPVVSIRTADGSSEFIDRWLREDKLAGRIGFTDASVTVREGRWLLDGAAAQVRARGNWTLDYPKKSIRIRFDQKQAMPGMAEGEKYRSWVLLADWKDLSMLHNPTALYLARAILTPDGLDTPDFRHVEVYVNGDYRGVYLLTEQPEIQPGRTSVTEGPRDDPRTDIGYLFEYDAYAPEEQTSPVGDPVFFLVHSDVPGAHGGYTIKSDVHSDAQVARLAHHAQLVYTIAQRAVQGKMLTFNADRTAAVPLEGATAEEAIGKVIHLESLVDMYVLSELCHDPDVAWSSFFITVDLSREGDGRLRFEWPWDYDSAFGIRTGYETHNQLFAAASDNPWFRLVADQDWFQRRVREKWASIRSAGVTDTALALIDRHQQLAGPAFDRNFQRWPDRITGGNHELTEELNGFTTQQQAADHLARWLRARIAFLDSCWLKP